MNEYFSFSRFKGLNQEFWGKSWKLVLTLAVSALIILPWCLIKAESLFNLLYSEKFFENVQSNIFQSGFQICSIIIGFLWFYPLIYKNRRITYLTNPTSTFEKTAITFLWCVILFTFTYILVFFILDVPIHEWAVSFEKEMYFKQHKTVVGFKSPALIKIWSTEHLFLITNYLSIQAAILLIMVTIRRFAIFKTLPIIGLIGLIYYLYNTYIIPNFLTPADWFFNSDAIRKNIDPSFIEYLSIEVSPGFTYLKLIIPTIVFILLWIAMYFKIAEREI